MRDFKRGLQQRKRNGSQDNAKEKDIFKDPDID